MSKKKISIYRPTIKRKDLEYVLNCMILDKVDYGEFANNFEKKLKDKYQIKNVVVINSFFNSILISLLSMEVGKNDEVIIPSYCPQIYLNVVSFLKAKPVLIDMEKEMVKPSLKSLEKAVSKKTKALILPYLFGYYYDPKPFVELVPNTIEDITSVLGLWYEDTPLGSFGKYAIADFSSKGLITTGEGGAVFSSNRNNYNKTISLLEIKYDIEYFPRCACLMPDLNAAMGLSQNETLKHRLVLREKIGKIYEEAIKRSHGTFLLHNENEDRLYSDFPAIFKSSLKETMKYFRKNNIEVVKPFDYPLHQYLKLDKKDYPNTEHLYLKVLLIPIYASLLKKDVDLISKVCASII